MKPAQISEDRKAEAALLKAGALQSAIFNSANFSSIATDARGVIQIFNVGAERMLGYAAVDVINKITPAEISDSQEVIARARALSVELGTPITPGFEALVFKASRGIEDIYELTYIRKDGSRFPAVVSVTALRDPGGAIIGYLLIGTDNTARKEAEAALLEAGALQSAIFNSANFSSIATDARGVIQIFNVGAERMLGYTAAEVMNKITPAEISDPEEVIARATALSLELRTAITPGFEALVFKASRGIEDIYELTYIRKDGSRFPAVVSVTALRDAQGGILGYLLIGTDNTVRKQVEGERKRLDQRLRDQQFYTRSLIESNIDALVTTDPSGIITDINKQMEALTGCTRDELIGAPFKNHFTDPERAEAGIKLVLGERKVTDYELTACARDGRKTDVSYNATTFYDRERNLQGVFGAARDVTDRKRADEELQRANAKLKAWAQALNSFAIVAETDTQGRIIFANDPFCMISRYSREELLGKDHRDVVNSGHHSKEFWTGMWSSISRGQIWRGEVKNRAKDGTVYWVDTVIVPLLDASGRPETYLAIRFVITERKVAEQALQEAYIELKSAKSAAEKANLAKSDFLSSMSHELRSPLNAILGFAQLMESSSPEPTTSQNKSIAQILQAGWYLLKLINEILDLSVIESGKVSLSKESVALANLLLECQAMMEPEAQQRRIQMTFPRFDAPVFVSADRTRLKQIVVNLLSNAIKYNQEQGNVTVDCQALDSQHIRISVTDTGAGLSREQLGHLFSPFNRLGQEAGSVPGTGIGLVVCKRLAELMSGGIGVESTVGKGSVFWCELPSAEAPCAVAGGSDTGSWCQAAGTAGPPPHTVLYVEDNPANMKLVEELIARFPEMRLVTAINGTLGIERARATRPQVILMDINLPGLSGIQVLKILRKDAATALIPVIALSANAMPRDIEKGLEAGFFRYLTKPIKIKELMDTLREALEFAESGESKTPGEVDKP